MREREGENRKRVVRKQLKEVLKTKINIPERRNKLTERGNKLQNME